MKFRKKPVVIEAFLWTGQVHAIAEWAARADFEHRKASGRPAEPEVELPLSFIDGHLEILTPEGTMRASIGDWVIQGVAGEFYFCKPEIFLETYDSVLS